METIFENLTMTGKSSSIEQSINIFSEMLKNNECDLEEILNMVLNQKLPNELRSIAWRIFLGILPKDKPFYEWYQITQNFREKFEKLNQDEEIKKFTKVIRKESMGTLIASSPFKYEYFAVFQEKEKISYTYDFFKSEIVGETLIKIYLIWIKNNYEVSQLENVNNRNFYPFYILAGIIFSLYPSILFLKPNIEEINFTENIDPNSLFYFLNNEEFFDADVYCIFDNLMNNRNLKIMTDSFKNLNQQEWGTIKNSIVENENFLPLNEENEILFSNLNRFEKISYFYLKLTHDNLLRHLFSIKLDPYDIIHIWYVSLLTSSMCFEHLSYI